MRAVCTVVGKDRPGIIAAVTTVLAERSVNILDISQTIMQGFFTMITLVDLTAMAITLDELRRELDGVAQRVGVTVTVQHEDVFSTMNRV